MSEVLDSTALFSGVPDFERRFQGILVADVVAYTRLMEKAELETHIRYRTLRVEVIDPSILDYRGEIVKNTGDGFVAVFESPLDTLQAAYELQRAIGSKERTEPPERRIVFRVGVHWDHVIFDLRDVYGSGVNIAARLQAVSPGGGIVVSSALIDEVRDKTTLSFEDLGEIRLKNLAQTIHAFSVPIAGLDSHDEHLFGSLSAISPRTQLPSIAVLPFKDESAGRRYDYFAEGCVENIIDTLSGIPELFVVSRGSTMEFRQQQISFKEVGQRLGVKYIVTGTVRRTKARMRLSVELVEVANTSIMWAQIYNITPEQLFSVQDEIAMNVVATVTSYVRKAEVKRALRKPPSNLTAYDYMLRALDLLYRFDFVNFSRARALLEKAQEEDESYAAPYAYLAHWHIFNIAEGWSMDADVDAAEVIRLSKCAIEREPSHALALSVQGHGQSMFFHDYDTALDLFDRALAIAPSNSWAWALSSATFGFIGDALTGIARAERAIRLSPLDEQSFFSHCLLAQNHYLHGTYDDAVRWSRRSLSSNPRFGNAARVLSASLIAAGRGQEAHDVSRAHNEMLPRFRVSEYARRCPFIEPQKSLYLDRLRAAGIAE
jgi:adenylate cyclase